MLKTTLINRSGKSTTKKMDTEDQVAGRFTRIDGESFYAISDYDQLKPFLISVVSESDHWMYLSTQGGLTAGRRNPEGALFAYDSVDKIHQCHTHTGPCTAIRVRHADGRTTLWEPFTQSAKDVFGVRRHLYKSALGDSVIFEEVNGDLGLTFRYRWRFSEAYGFIRSATLANAGDSVAHIHLMDGLLNILPSGISLPMHQRQHCLADAYKYCEADPKTTLAVYSLSSMITDRPEPGELLRATLVWSVGLVHPSVSLNPLDRLAFRRGVRAVPELSIKGQKGAYLVSGRIDLEPGALHTWHIVADVQRSQSQAVSLRKQLRDDKNLAPALIRDSESGSKELLKNVARADALQTTGTRICSVHHMVNVLFNNMRGGVFDHNYDVGRDNLAGFIMSRNREVAGRVAGFLGRLDDRLSIQSLVSKAQTQDDPDLERLCYEYLPIYFSRRHGDPSRPWNVFDIRLKNNKSERVLAYQGNWRDIFQNWEALCQSFPGFVPSVIAKFVNAMTIDGFNPYRITDRGIDWELIDPKNPWSNIGYWGDHQIIYLLKFLETARKYLPGQLESLLTREVFSYANVPYALKPYQQVLEDPHHTIEYDQARAQRVRDHTGKLGADGRLLLDRHGDVYHVNLAEKLLVPALSKISNLVIEGGLWLNTQRPEWNDANNALVGNGLSVVTLCYLRRYLVFCSQLFDAQGQEELPFSHEVSRWLAGVSSALNDYEHLLSRENIEDTDRKQFLDALGEAFGAYRARVYAHGFSGKDSLVGSDLSHFCNLALRFVERSIQANRRPDGMYHAYNLMALSEQKDRASVNHLYEMLEGQVAALSSGLLDADQVLQLLETLRGSVLYREDQDSYLLYPERTLPGFFEKNIIPEMRFRNSQLIQRMIEAGDDRIVTRDADGNARFCGDFHNAKDLRVALNDLGRETRWRDLVEREQALLLDIFEDVFNHKAFTGRSGGMYGYEGLGCIYWHMIAKLLLAVQECYYIAVDQGQPEHTIAALAQAYYRVRQGLGFNKTPQQYGAFPTDPYSHTPAFAGARQPGMTGQVKEEILTRFGELGVLVNHGQISFRPSLLKAEEFLRNDTCFTYYDPQGLDHQLTLAPGSLAFTYCQVPVVYHLTDGGPAISVTLQHGQTTAVAGDTLPPDLSEALFDRSGQVTRIDVHVPTATLLSGA